LKDVRKLHVSGENVFFAEKSAKNFPRAGGAILHTQKNAKKCSFAFWIITVRVSYIVFWGACQKIGAPQLPATLARRRSRAKKAPNFFHCGAFDKESTQACKK
jgi:hypothetical protein